VEKSFESVLLSMDGFSMEDNGSVTLSAGILTISLIKKEDNKRMEAIPVSFRLDAKRMPLGEIYPSDKQQEKLSMSGITSKQ